MKIENSKLKEKLPELQKKYEGKKIKDKKSGAVREIMTVGYSPIKNEDNSVINCHLSKSEDDKSMQIDDSCPLDYILHYYEFLP
jgi:hypothetical protein